MLVRGAGKSKGFQDARYRALVEKLVQRRKDLGLSQSKLATLLQNHQHFVARYELGERRLDVVEFVDVATVLGLDLEPLLVEVRQLGAPPTT